MECTKVYWKAQILREIGPEQGIDALQRFREQEIGCLFQPQTVGIEKMVYADPVFVRLMFD